ncbi:MAG: hypothetical protein ACLSAH_12910 [Bilophila wadsworthia]
MTASVPMSAARMPLVIDASPRGGAYSALFERGPEPRGAGAQEMARSCASSGVNWPLMLAVPPAIFH